MGKIEEGEDTAAPPSQAAAALRRTQAAERERERGARYIYIWWFRGRCFRSKVFGRLFARRGVLHEHGRHPPPAILADQIIIII
jgi:hypothetical protein